MSLVPQSHFRLAFQIPHIGFLAANIRKKMEEVLKFFFSHQRHSVPLLDRSCFDCLLIVRVF